MMCRAPSRRDPSQRALRSAGFTMIELLVAMLILAVALTGLAALQLSTIRNVTDAERYAGATRLAEGVIARYKVESLNNIRSMSVPDPPEWTIEVARDGQPMRNIGISGEGPGPYTVQRLVEDLTGGRRLITIRVTWLQTGVSTADGGAAAYRTNSLMMTLQRAQ